MAASFYTQSGVSRRLLLLSGASAAALLPTFTTTAAGLVPAASGGSTTTQFLRKDGTWAVPAGGGGGLSDGDYGDISVSGGATVFSIDYTAVNAVIAPTWANITGKPVVASPILSWAI